MNRDEFEGNWRQLKGKLKEKWGKFTEDDITRMNGKYDQFLGSLQKKYGYSKEKAEQELKNWKYESKKEHFRQEERNFGEDRPDHDEGENRGKKRKAG